MRKIGILGIAGLLALILAACGGGGGTHTVVIQTLSDPSADGDIGFSAPPPTYSFSQAAVSHNVLYGLDGSGAEFRAFLDFPLDGATGGGVVPAGAEIVSADVEIFVNNVSFSSSVPTLLDLVSYSASGLTNADFDSAPFLTRSGFDIHGSDAGRFVRIDVTSLVAEAQRRGLRDVQLRFLLDFVPGANGLVEIDDAAADRAPLLTVEYR